MADRVRFRIRMRNLVPTIDDAGGLGLAPTFSKRSLRSGFLVPSRSRATGLRVPFDATLDLAGIFYQVDLQEAKDGDGDIYGKGMRSIPYRWTTFQCERYGMAPGKSHRVDQAGWAARRKISQQLDGYKSNISIR